MTLRRRSNGGGGGGSKKGKGIFGKLSRVMKRITAPLKSRRSSSRSRSHRSHHPSRSKSKPKSIKSSNDDQKELSRRRPRSVSFLPPAVVDNATMSAPGNAQYDAAAKTLVYISPDGRRRRKVKISTTGKTHAAIHRKVFEKVKMFMEGEKEETRRGRSRSRKRHNNSDDDHASTIPNCTVYDVNQRTCMFIVDGSLRIVACKTPPPPPPSSSSRQTRKVNPSSPSSASARDIVRGILKNKHERSPFATPRGILRNKHEISPFAEAQAPAPVPEPKSEKEIWKRKIDIFFETTYGKEFSGKMDAFMRNAYGRNVSDTIQLFFNNRWEYDEFFGLMKNIAQLLDKDCYRSNNAQDCLSKFKKYYLELYESEFIRNLRGNRLTRRHSVVKTEKENIKDIVNFAELVGYCLKKLEHVYIFTDADFQKPPSKPPSKTTKKNTAAAAAAAAADFQKTSSQPPPPPPPPSKPTTAAPDHHPVSVAAILGDDAKSPPPPRAADAAADVPAVDSLALVPYRRDNNNNDDDDAAPDTTNDDGILRNRKIVERNDNNDQEQVYPRGVLKIIKGHSEMVHSVAYCPTGLYFASGSFDGTIKIWDANTFSLRDTIKNNGDIWSIAYHPKGSHIISGDSRSVINVWNVVQRPPRLEQTLKGHEPLKDEKTKKYTTHISSPMGQNVGGVLSVTYNHTGSHIISGGSDTTVKVWDSTTNACTHTLGGHTHFVFSVVWCNMDAPPASCMVSASYDGTVRLWDTVSYDCIRVFYNHSDIRSVACYSTSNPSKNNFYNICILVFSTDRGPLLYDNKIKITADRKMQVIEEFTSQYGDTDKPTTGFSVACSSWFQTFVDVDIRNVYFAFGESDGTVTVADDLSFSKICQFAGQKSGHSGKVLSVAFSPDRSRIISGGADNTIRVYRNDVEPDTTESVESVAPAPELAAAATESESVAPAPDLAAATESVESDESDESVYDDMPELAPASEVAATETTINEDVAPAAAVSTNEDVAPAAAADVGNRVANNDDDKSQVPPPPSPIAEITYKHQNVRDFVNYGELYPTVVSLWSSVFKQNGIIYLNNFIPRILDKDPDLIPSVENLLQKVAILLQKVKSSNENRNSMFNMFSGGPSIEQVMLWQRDARKIIEKFVLPFAPDKMKAKIKDNYYMAPIVSSS